MSKCSFALFLTFFVGIPSCIGMVCSVYYASYWIVHKKPNENMKNYRSGEKGNSSLFVIV